MTTRHERNVQVILGELTLEGILGLPPDPSGVIVFAHGSGSGRLSPRTNFVAHHHADCAICDGTARYRCYASLWACSLSHEGQNKIIWITLDKSDFDAIGISPKTYTGLSGYLIQADEAYISATFTELEPNVVECGFRAVPGFDVSQIALQLSGGGHVLASGCTVRGKSLADVESEVVTTLKQIVKHSKPLYK